MICTWLFADYLDAGVAEEEVVVAEVQKALAGGFASLEEASPPEA